MWRRIAGAIAWSWRRSVGRAAAPALLAAVMGVGAGGCAHAPPSAWSVPTAMTAVGPCVQPAELAAVPDLRAGIVAELTKSGLAAPAEALSPTLAEVIAPAELDALARAAADGRCRRVSYRVDGLRVVGFVLVPPGARASSLPAVLYARGGNRDFGKLDVYQLSLLQMIADAGFVVLATQYRGVDGGDGKDEFGGDEVHDLEALLPLARGVREYDGARAYLWGHSRGGMEAYEALRDGLPVRAAAIGGGVADLGRTMQKRPEMAKVVAAVVPGWEGATAEARGKALEHRSALRWADKVQVPLLLMHAREDWRVELAQSVAMDATLTRLGREHRLVVFDGDAHQLFLHRRAMVEAMVGWFRGH